MHPVVAVAEAVFIEDFITQKAHQKACGNVQYGVLFDQHGGQDDGNSQDICGYAYAFTVS